MHANSSTARHLLKALDRHPHIRLAMVFGSVARGTARADSDLDLAVDAGRSLSAEERRALIEDLAEVSGRPVDLIDLRTAGEPLLGRIMHDGVMIRGRKSDRGQWLYRHLIEQADFLPYRNRILKERRQKWIGN